MLGGTPLLSQNKFLYLGLIEILSGNIVVIDPYINDISILADKIRPADFFSQRITRVKNGSYACYVLHGDSGTANYLLTLHEECDISDIDAMKFDAHGMVSCKFGHAVCI